MAKGFDTLWLPLATFFRQESFRLLAGLDTPVECPEELASMSPARSSEDEDIRESKDRKRFDVRKLTPKRSAKSRQKQDDDDDDDESSNNDIPQVDFRGSDSEWL